MNGSGIFFYSILGVFIGMTGVTFGVGGGAIIVPVLTLMTAMQQKDAQGTALVIMIPMAIMGALRYHWNPEIHLDWRIISVLMIAVIIGANIGAEIIGRVSNRALQMGFGFLLLIIAIRMIWESMHISTV